MPIRLIGTIILLILVTIFAGVNLDNKCDITFIFYTFKNIPVFMTVIVSFAIGAVLMLPFTFGRKKKRKCPKIEKAPDESKEQAKQAEQTLFDFKIKREAKSGESEKPKTENGNEKKGLFGFGKKKPKDSEKSSGNAGEAHASDAENTGAPV